MHRTLGRSGIRGASLETSLGCCRAELGRATIPDLLSTPFRRTSDRTRVPPSAAAYHALDRHHDSARSRCLFSLADRVRRRRIWYTDRMEGIPLLLGAFQSYSSEREVRANLASQPVQDVERSSLAPGDRRPVQHRYVGSCGIPSSRSAWRTSGYFFQRPANERVVLSN